MNSGTLKTSTPIQYRFDSGFESYKYDVPLVSSLSPIRKQCPLKPASKTLNETFNQIRKKLTFASLDINESDSKFSDDSGILYDHSSTENESLTAFPTDENFNIISSCNKTDKYLPPFKYVCGDHIFFLNELKFIKQNENVFQSKLLDNVSANEILDNVLSTQSKLDILNELAIRNCKHILSSIFSCLSGEELRRAYCVSKKWRYIIDEDNKANDKRKAYISNKKNTCRQNKENRFKTSFVERSHKCVLSIANRNEALKSSVPNFTRFDSFIEEAKLIKGEQILKKCPTCQYPSRAVTEYMFCCTRKLCEYEFCKKCLGPYLSNHSCSEPTLNDSMENFFIGSKKSKKNLKRL